jgi:hypothetical protein
VVSGRLSGGTRRRRILLAAIAVARRPSLWLTAVHQVGVLARPGWWLRWPPVPIPDPAYLRFRLEVAYGNDRPDPEVTDVVAYLQWCRQMRRLGQR